MHRQTSCLQMVLRAVWIGTLLAAAGVCRTAAADGTPTPLDQLLSEIVREQVPHEYENNKKWGGTKEVFDGLKVWRDGLRIKTKRRRKEVNHGTWKRYRLWLLEPDRRFQLRITNLRSLPDGTATFDATVDARLGAFGRLSQWERGVQLISLGVDAEATVELRASCRLALQLDPSRLPPDVLLVPEIERAELVLHDFRLLRISNLRGPLVKELGEELHDVLAEELRERSSTLRDRLNRQLAKRQDHLRLSLHQLVASKWAAVIAPQAAVALPVEQAKSTETETTTPAVP